MTAKEKLNQEWTSLLADAKAFGRKYVVLRNGKVILREEFLQVRNTDSPSPSPGNSR